MTWGANAPFFNMIQDTLIGYEKWREAWFWFRNAPHQQKAVNRLYAEILELPGGACLLSKHAQWFEEYRAKNKLVKDFMHFEGE